MPGSSHIGARHVTIHSHHQPPGGGHQILCLVSLLYIDITAVLAQLSYEALMRNDAFNCLPDLIPGQIMPGCYTVLSRPEAREESYYLILSLLCTPQDINITVLVKCVYFICVRRNISDILVV